MEKEPVVEKDPILMRACRESSWICYLFQEYGLSVKEKQYVIRALIEDFKVKNAKNCKVKPCCF